MMKDPQENRFENICRRSYYGSLYLLFFLFLFFIYKTSLCSKTASDLNIQNTPAGNVTTAETISESALPDSCSKQVPDSNKYSQKNKIKELTVNKKLVNINTASVDELTELKGIGKKIAAEIVKFRNENGSFGSTEDIMKVKGIGKGKYSAIKENIILK